MPRNAGTCEEVITPVAVVCVVVHVRVVRIVVLTTPCSSLVILTMTVAHVEVGLYDAAGVVYVCAGVGTALGVASCLQRAVVARLAVALEDYVYNTRGAFGAELRRGVVYDFYLLYTLGRQLLEYLSAVLAGKTARLTVNPHLHALVAA